MLVETNLEEIIKNVIGNNTKIINNSICGKCSKCGECCTNILPVSQSEIDKIQKYVIKNNIKTQKQILVMQNELTCPYYNGKKCLIYEVRPLICKEFYCYKKPNAKVAKKFTEHTYIIVDMWDIAERIEKQRSNL